MIEHLFVAIYLIHIYINTFIFNTAEAEAVRIKRKRRAGSTTLQKVQRRRMKEMRRLTDTNLIKPNQTLGNNTIDDNGTPWTYTLFEMSQCNEV